MYRLFNLVLFVLSLSPTAALFGHFYLPERLAFPPLCEKHYRDPRKYTAHTWIEPIDEKALAELEPYLEYLPKPYEADCSGCSGCGGMRLSRRDEFSLPFEKPKFAYDELTKLHQQVRYGTLETCRQRPTDRCEGFCWDGGYFRRLNSKYFPFFKEFLVYTSQNRLCKCFWHERSVKAVEINNFVYRFLHTLVEQKLILSNYSPYWVSREIQFDRKGRILGKEYFPNNHGMASSLVTYLVFYSHYQKMLMDLTDAVDVYAKDYLQAIVAKDQIFEVLEELQDKFMPLYMHCLAIHPHPKIYMERSLLKLQRGEAQQALEDILVMMELSKAEKFQNINFLTSEVLLQIGETYAALKQDEKAIEFYNRAIEEPNSAIYLKAHFLRAIAQFEIGNLEAALKDCQLSKKGEQLATVTGKTTEEFKEQLIKGVRQGLKEPCEVVEDYSRCHRILWGATDSPIDDHALQLFANACEEIGRTFVGALQGERVPEEIAQLFASYALLGENEKGERLGIVIGKYGISCFANSRRMKQVVAFNKLQEANCICNFTALGSSKTGNDEKDEHFQNEK